MCFLITTSVYRVVYPAVGKQLGWFTWFGGVTTILKHLKPTFFGKVITLCAAVAEMWAHSTPTVVRAVVSRRDGQQVAAVS